VYMQVMLCSVLFFYDEMTVVKLLCLIQGFHIFLPEVAMLKITNMDTL
jgi:hypothetical protein